MVSAWAAQQSLTLGQSLPRAAGGAGEPGFRLCGYENIQDLFAGAVAFGFDGVSYAMLMELQPHHSLTRTRFPPSVIARMPSGIRGNLVAVFTAARGEPLLRRRDCHAALAMTKVGTHEGTGPFQSHCEERSDAATSGRLDGLACTNPASGTRLPRCARNDKSGYA